ncbi:hypothetical protein HPB49_020023 [Dermacentor silvarum]|uniref:Uncharacterized protein n=1 Tax=Dermacentor silvarum TaxID=543639 RepID=A0ACB8C5A7_DERSI|nr:hypothetical protein HPB49_020023 [Dermacentor silvarum]
MHRNPQPYGGFAGVPAYAEEPNVIVFVPRPPSMRKAALDRDAQPYRTALDRDASIARTVTGSSRCTPRDFYSPTVLSLDQPDRRQSLQRREKIPLTRECSLLCSDSHVHRAIRNNICFLRDHPRRHNTCCTKLKHVQLPPYIASYPTDHVHLSAAFSRLCRHLADVQGAMNLTASAHIPYGPIYRNLYCIYNNSRVRKGPGRHFIPADLPLTYHLLVLSSSTGDDRTKLYLLVMIGRNFPQCHQKRHCGKPDHKLRHMSATAGHSNSVILAAIGGYPEDSPEFSLLGDDAGAKSRFAASSLDVVKRHRLNGTAIHWVSPDSQCQDPHDEDTLLHIVAVQRHIFDLNGYHAVIAALGLMPSGFDLTVCDVISQRASALLSNLSTYPQNAHKICAGVSLAPWLVNGNVSQGLNNLSTSFAGQYPGAPGTAAVFELCTGPICAVHQGVQQCVAFTQQTLYGTQSPISMYLFLNEPMLNTIMLWGAARGPGPNGTCVVLYDLDRGCSNLSEWMSLRRVQAALAGNPLISALTQVPAC